MNDLSQPGFRSRREGPARPSALRSGELPGPMLYLLLLSILVPLLPLFSKPLPESGELPTPPSGDRDSFSNVLVPKGELLWKTPAGTFFRDRYDFLETAGSGWKGDGPRGSESPVEREGKTLQDTHRINSDIAREAKEAALEGDRERLLAILERSRRALKADPLFFPYRYNTGRILLLLGRPAEARIHFGKCRALIPRFHGCDLNLGRCYEAMRNREGALFSYREAVRKNPLSPEGPRALGEYLLKEGAPGRAADAFKEAKAREKSPLPSLIDEARLLLSEGDRVRSRELLLEVLERLRREEKRDAAPAGGEEEPEAGDPEERKGKRNELRLQAAFLIGEIDESRKRWKATAEGLQEILKSEDSPFFLAHPRGELRLHRSWLLSRPRPFFEEEGGGEASPEGESSPGDEGGG